MNWLPVCTASVIVRWFTLLPTNAFKEKSLFFKAGVSVTLNPGFRIDGSNGAKFVAYTGPCPGGGVPPGYAAPTMNGLSGYLIENK